MLVRELVSEKSQDGRTRTDVLQHPKQEPTQPKPLLDKVDASAEPSACTSACTSKPETVQPGTVEALATALQALPPADRARLAALLLDQGAGPAERKGGMPGALADPSAGSRPQGAVNTILCDPAPVCGVLLDGSSNSGREAPKT